MIKEVIMKNSNNNVNATNIKNDVKSYEKQLNEFKSLFVDTKLRGHKHFFAFDDLQEGIRVAKTIRKLYFKLKLEEFKEQIDDCIFRTMEC